MEFAEYQGFIGDQGELFVRLFDADRLDEINQLYMVQEYLPGYLLIGSDAALEGIFVAPDGSVVQIPFIPMSADLAKVLFSSTEEFRTFFFRTFREDDSYPKHLTRMAVHPIALGGSPTDPGNFKDAPEDIHVKATAYWNKVYRHAIQNSDGGQQTDTAGG